MCGIFGIALHYNSNSEIMEQVYQSLYHMKNRGRDSYGWCQITSDNRIILHKKFGKITKSNSNDFEIKNLNFCLGHNRYITSQQQHYSSQKLEEWNQDVQKFINNSCFSLILDSASSNPSIIIKKYNPTLNNIFIKII